MRLKSVAIMSPGDMGHAVGQVLGSKGLRVISYLRDRSMRTKRLAASAGIEEVSSIQELVREADIILSILVPSEAVEAARVVARAIEETRSTPFYADCNAISPQTSKLICELITTSGGRYIDASIVGAPPGKGGTTLFYCSGPYADAFSGLSSFGLRVIVLGEEIGKASAMKMCYGAMTKGMVALFTQFLAAAERLGVKEPLRERVSSGFYSGLIRHLENEIPKMPERSARWVGEMEEIAKTFEKIGLTPKIFEGAADLYRQVSKTQLALRNPEDPFPRPTLDEVIAGLCSSLGENPDTR